jgi:Nucleotidyl transferase AbiEii toxin, Type IV TA system
MLCVLIWNRWYERTKALAASVNQRLHNHAKASNEDFNLLLMRFANERFLYRLSVSDYKDGFLLKGASLFVLWFNVPHRPTRDVDLLGFGSSEIADIEKIFRVICEIESEDDLIFDSESVKGEDIKEGQEYQGVRIKFSALLGNSGNK